MKLISLLFLMILCGGCGSMPPKTVMSQPGVVPSIMELSPDNAHAGGPGITVPLEILEISERRGIILPS
jgi:hypothetical protein